MFQTAYELYGSIKLWVLPRWAEEWMDGGVSLSGRRGIYFGVASDYNYIASTMEAPAE